MKNENKGIQFGLHNSKFNFDDEAQKDFLKGAKIAYETIITDFSDNDNKLTTSKPLLSKKETNQVFAELNLSNDGLIEFGSYVDDVSDGFQRMLDEVPMGRVELTM